MQIWILEKGEANNVSYDKTRTAYDSYQEAKNEAEKQFEESLKDLEYDEETIAEMISEHGCDAEGNDLYEDEEGEFYYLIYPVEK